MKILTKVAEVRDATANSPRVGLVPTMGALHEGHLSLIRAARANCDVVVVWLFVNPTQFNDATDLAAYPRNQEHDAALAESAGADILFAPAVDEVYPTGFASTVRVAGISDILEGAHRRGHFDAVATVVTKMLNMVRPQIAFFGAKDAQQVAVVQRLVADLNIDTQIEVLPIVREPDGLARSSRNVHLTGSDRQRATALYRGLCAAHKAAAAGERKASNLIAAVERQLAEVGLEPDYVALVDPTTFQNIETVTGPALIALAVRVGSTRLIDNIEVAP